MPLIISTEMSLEDKASYLRTLPAIRERCGRVFELAKAGKLDYFDYHADKESKVTDFCLNIIQVSAIITQIHTDLTIDIIQRDFGTDYSKVFFRLNYTIIYQQYNQPDSRILDPSSWTLETFRPRKKPS